MSALAYLLRRNLINAIKDIRRRPAVLISYIVMAAFLALVLLTNLLDPPKEGGGSADPDVFGGIAAAVVLLLFFMETKKGLTSGGSFFRLADVFLVFTSPLRPKSVLVYGFVRTMLMTLLSVFFLAYQIPNISNHYEIEAGGLFLLFAAYFGFMLFLSFYSMFLYFAVSGSARVRTYANQVFNGLLVLLGGITAAFILQEGDLLRAADRLLNHEWFAYVPVVGWFKTIFMAVLAGMSVEAWIAAASVTGVFLVMAVIYWFLQADYYEDVLTATERNEERIRAAKEGKSSVGTFQKTRTRAIRNALGGSGASAVFYRHMLEYRKTGWFLFSRFTIALIVVGVLTPFAYKDLELRYLLAMMIYLLFFTSLAGKWGQEMEKPFIYLLPDSALKKLFFATLAPVCKHLVDGLALFVTAGVALRAFPPEWFLAALGYASYALLFIYLDVLGRRWFGSIHSKVLNVMLRMLVLLLFVLPGTIVGMVLAEWQSGVPGIELWFYAVVIGYNLALAVGIYFASYGLFEKMEYQ